MTLLSSCGETNITKSKMKRIIFPLFVWGISTFAIDYKTEYRIEQIM